MLLSAQLRSGNPIQADPRFSCLNGQVSVNFWRDANHKLTAVSLAGNRLRHVFAGMLHVLDDILDNLPDTFQG